MQELKKHILVFLPVMKELEKMGHNPVESLFGGGELSLSLVEDSYTAIHKASAKYPRWKKVISEYVSRLMERKEDV